MASITIRHVWNDAEVQRLLRSPNGGVVRDLMKRGHRVQRAAQQILRSAGRVDHGILLGSITVVPFATSNMTVVRVGTNIEYAMWVHDGTGLYGPRHALIFPRRAKVMVWTPRKVSGVFIKRGNRTQMAARHTKGMKGTPFLKAALPAARL